MNKKITLATFKSFIKRESAIDQLYVRCDSSFDGMVDCVMPVESVFKKVETLDFTNKYTLGIPSAWLVGSSRDYFTDWSDANYIGIEVYNCCGSFIVAMPRR